MRNLKIIGIFILTILVLSAAITAILVKTGIAPPVTDKFEYESSQASASSVPKEVYEQFAGKKFINYGGVQDLKTKDKGKIKDFLPDDYVDKPLIIKVIDCDKMSKDLEANLEKYEGYVQDNSPYGVVYICVSTDKSKAQMLNNIVNHEVTEYPVLYLDRNENSKIHCSKMSSYQVFLRENGRVYYVLNIKTPFFVEGDMPENNFPEVSEGDK